VNRPWDLPATAWLDNRWNQALDLAASVPVSRAKVAAAWERSGPDRTLATLRALAGKDAATEGAA